MNARVDGAPRKTRLNEGQQTYVIERLVQATDKVGELIATLHDDKELCEPGTPLGMALDALLLLWTGRWEALASGGDVSLGKSEKTREADRV